MGLADIFGKLGGGISAGATKLADILKTGMPQPQAPQETQPQPTGEGEQQTQNQVWQDKLKQANEIFANNQFTPQEYKVNPLPQMNWGQNKQYGGLSGLYQQSMQNGLMSDQDYNRYLQAQRGY